MTALANTILIIDDDPLHLQLYSWMMKKEGYHAVTALVGSNSVDFPASQAVDLVLLDYRLNSSLTAREIASLVNEKHPAVPIIVLSELPWPPDDIREFAKAFVSKDEPATLMKSIASLIAAHSETERHS